jgi:lipopolysaccharide transport system permease protein
MIVDARAAQYVAWRILVRDLSARYRQTALGFLWAFIPPLAVAAALSLASGSRVLQVGQTPIPYVAYVVFGVVLWQAFAEAATSPIQAVAEARSMLTRINFPREALLMAKGADVIVNFFVKAVLVGAVFAWYGVPVYWTAFFALFALFAMVLLGLAIGTILAPIGAIYQDAPRVLSVALSFWFFLTPIAYPLPTDGLFSAVVRLNPVTPLVVAIQDLTTQGTLTMPFEFFTVATLSIMLFIIAWVLFRLTMPYVIERMGS